jgi:hypothetical protein
VRGFLSMRYSNWFRKGRKAHAALRSKSRRPSEQVLRYLAFLVRAGEYETLYGAMPRAGLTLAGRHVPISYSRESARQRLTKEPAV